jgi:formylglycine-generating enzyme
MGGADTETGAYTLSPGPDPATPINVYTVTRNAGAEFFVPTRNEWHKAAYYDVATASYFFYPTRSDTETTCSAPTSASNAANCGNQIADVTGVGSYANAASPYGTFDQGGNVGEWTETITGSTGSTTRYFLGGSYLDQPGALTGGGGAFGGNINGPQSESSVTGFRVASTVPEPGTGVLVACGLIALAVYRSARGTPSFRGPAPIPISTSAKRECPADLHAEGNRRR